MIVTPKHQNHARDDDAASTGTLMDEARVEELLSEKLMQGFLLLDRSCLRCVTPLVKQEQALGDRTTRQDINAPIPGVPFCVSCRAHVMTDEDDIFRLQKHYQGKALQGRILVDFDKGRKKSLIDDATVDTEETSTRGSDHREDAEAICNELTPAAHANKPNIEFGTDMEEIELICAASEEGNVIADAMTDNESVIASIMEGFEDELLEPYTNHNGKLVVKAQTQETDDSTQASKVVVKAQSGATESTDSTNQSESMAAYNRAYVSFPGSNDEHWPSFEDRKMIATKILSVKMLQGHRLLEKQCRKCSMPMTEFKGEMDCVICPVLHRRVLKAKEKKEEVSAISRRRQDHQIDEQRRLVQKRKSLLFEGAKSRTALMPPVAAGVLVNPVAINKINLFVEAHREAPEQNHIEERVNDHIPFINAVVQEETDAEQAISGIDLNETNQKPIVYPKEELMIVQANSERSHGKNDSGQQQMVATIDRPSQSNDFVVSRGVLRETLNPTNIHEKPPINADRRQKEPPTEKHDDNDQIVSKQVSDELAVDHRSITENSSDGSSILEGEITENGEPRNSHRLGGAANLFTGCAALGNVEMEKTLKSDETSSPSLLTRAASRPGEVQRAIMGSHIAGNLQIAKPFLKKNAYKKLETGDKSTSRSSEKGRPARPVMKMVKITPQLPMEKESSENVAQSSTRQTTTNSSELSLGSNSTISSNTKAPLQENRRGLEPSVEQVGAVEATGIKFANKSAEEGNAIRKRNESKMAGSAVRDASRSEHKAMTTLLYPVFTEENASKESEEESSVVTQTKLIIDDFESKKRAVSKEIERRMTRGWIILSAACVVCGMPTMVDPSGEKEACVYCGEYEQSTLSVDPVGSTTELTVASEEKDKGLDPDPAVTHRLSEQLRDVASVTRVMRYLPKSSTVGSRNTDQASRNDPPAVLGYTLRRRSAADCDQSSKVEEKPLLKKMDPSDSFDEKLEEKLPIRRKDPAENEEANVDSPADSISENDLKLEDKHGNTRKDPAPSAEDANLLVPEKVDQVLKQRNALRGPSPESPVQSRKVPSTVLSEDGESVKVMNLPNYTLSTVSMKNNQETVDEKEDLTLAIPAGFDVNNEKALEQLIAAAKKGMPLHVDTGLEEINQHMVRVASPGLSAVTIPSPGSTWSQQKRARKPPATEASSLENGDSDPVERSRERSDGPPDSVDVSDEVDIHEMSSDGSSYGVPIIVGAERASQRTGGKTKYRIEPSEASSDSPETIVILEEDGDCGNSPDLLSSNEESSKSIVTLEDQDIQNTAFANEGNSTHGSITSEAIDVLLMRIEKTQAELAAAGDTSDSIEKRERLAQLLDWLSEAAAAVEEMDDDNYTTQTEDDSQYQ